MMLSILALEFGMMPTAGMNSTDPGDRWLSYYERPSTLNDAGITRSPIAFSIQFGLEDSIVFKAGMAYDSSWKSINTVLVEDSDGWYEFAVEFDSNTGMGKLHVNGVVVGNAAGYDATQEFTYGGSCNWGMYSHNAGYGQMDVDTVWALNGTVPDPPSPFLLGDANGDGVVSAGDYAAVQANFGAIAGGDAPAVPEPTTLCILALGGFAAIRCRKNIMNSKKSLILLMILALGSTALANYPDGWRMTYGTGNTPTDYTGVYSYNGFDPDNTTWDGSSPGIYSIISGDNAGEQRSWGFDTPFFPGIPNENVVNVGIRVQTYADGWNTTAPGERWYTYYEKPGDLSAQGVSRSALGFSIQFGTEDNIRFKTGMTSEGDWKGIADISVEDSEGWFDFVVEFDNATGKGKLYVNGEVVGDTAGYDLTNDYTVSGSCNWGNYVASSSDYGRFDVDTVWALNGAMPPVVTQPEFLYGDANGDGVVSAGDYAAVQSNFGAVAGGDTPSVPEPATICILAISGLAAIRRRNR